MAFSDYCRCEVCRKKAFYDASLSWGYMNRDRSIQVNQDGKQVPDGAGDYAGLCSECVKSYKLEAVKRS